MSCEPTCTLKIAAQLQPPVAVRLGTPAPVEARLVVGQGAKGPPGEPGATLPPGGTPGQVLTRGPDDTLAWKDVPTPTPSGPAPHADTHGEGAADPVTLAQAQIAGLTEALASKQPAGAYVTADDSRLTDARPPTTHGHGLGDVAGLPEALTDIETQLGERAGVGYVNGQLASKSDVGHQHEIGDVNGLAAALAAGGGSRVTLASADLARLFTNAIGITPFDDTPPQRTEGTELGAVEITPSSAGGAFFVLVSGMMAASNVGWQFAFALHDDTQLDALHAILWTRGAAGAGVLVPVPGLLAVVPNTSASPRRFSVRAGSAGASRALGICVNIDGTGAAYGAPSRARLVALHFS